MTRIITRECRNCQHWRPSLLARLVRALMGREAVRGRCLSRLSDYRGNIMPRFGWCSLHMFDMDRI